MCAASAIDKPGRSKVRTNLSAHILVRTPFRTSHTCHRIVIVLALNCRSVIHPLSIPTPGQCQWLRSKLADPNVPKPAEPGVHQLRTALSDLWRQQCSMCRCVWAHQPCLQPRMRQPMGRVHGPRSLRQKSTSGSLEAMSCCCVPAASHCLPHERPGDTLHVTVVTVGSQWHLLESEPWLALPAWRRAMPQMSGHH